MIRRAKILEIAEILELTKQCAQDMISRGIHQWNEHYPSEVAFAKDIDRGELFIKVFNKKIIGVIAISTYMDKEYEEVKWLTPNENNLYIHRLAVLPKYQGFGYARELMDYGEWYAKEKNYASIRLDTFSKNKRNQHFYEQRGYHKLEEIFFPDQSTHPFYCYELVL